jgi:hypothetical protein
MLFLLNEIDIFVITIQMLIQQRCNSKSKPCLSRQLRSFDLHWMIWVVLYLDLCPMKQIY